MECFKYKKELYGETYKLGFRIMLIELINNIQIKYPKALYLLPIHYFQH